MKPVSDPKDPPMLSCRYGRWKPAISGARLEKKTKKSREREGEKRGGKRRRMSNRKRTPLLGGVEETVGVEKGHKGRGEEEGRHTGGSLCLDPVKLTLKGKKGKVRCTLVSKARVQ